MSSTNHALPPLLLKAVQRPLLHTFSNADKVLLFCIGLLILALYAPFIPELLFFWEKPDYSHAYFVPALMFWAWWRERKNARAALGGSPMPAYILLVFSFILYTAGVFGSITALVFFSLWATVMAFLCICYGAKGLQKLWLIALAGLFALPWPTFIFQTVSFRLRLISSAISEYMLRLATVPVYVEGNIIDLGTIQLEVVDACSGLRYLLPSILMGIVAGYLYLHRPVFRLALGLMAIPVSVLCNALRIMATGILCKWFGPAMAEGFFHDFSGWLVYLLALSSLYLILLVLKRYDTQPQNEVGAQEATAQTLPLSFTKNRSRHILIASLIALLMLTLQFRTKPPLPEIPNFALFPSQVGPWQGNFTTLPAATVASLGTNNVVSAVYTHQQTGSTIYFLLTFYPSQTAGFAAHAPTSCLLGGGWGIVDKGELQEQSDRPFPIGKILLQKNSSRILSNYWFEQRGRVITNELLNKYYLFYDSLTTGRTDGALVRAELVLPSGVSEQAGQAILDAFFLNLRPELSNFIPGSPAANIL